MIDWDDAVDVLEEDVEVIVDEDEVIEILEDDVDVGDVEIEIEVEGEDAVAEEPIGDLQTRYLAVLEGFGFFKRIPDGWNIPMFGPGSPTALQIKRKQYPEWWGKMQDYIAKVKR
jgi:hypothetical protein